MKRGYVWLIVGLCLMLAVGLFAWFNMDGVKQEQRFSVVETSELQIMDIEKGKLDFSPIVSAILYSNLKDGHLPVSFTLEVVALEPSLPDSLYAGFVHKNVRLMALTTQQSVENRGDFYVFTCRFGYDASALLSQMEEMEVLEFLKSLPNVVPPQKVFVGSKDQAESFEKEGWKMSASSSDLQI